VELRDPETPLEHPPGGTSKKVVLRSAVFLDAEVPSGTTPGTPSGTLTVYPPIISKWRC
jgi:hypothetical protein